MSKAELSLCVFLGKLVAVHIRQGSNKWVNSNRGGGGGGGRNACGGVCRPLLGGLVPLIDVKLHPETF